MDNTQNVYDLESKIDWEGGYFSALEYGIRIDDYDVSEDIKEAWDEMAAVFSDFMDAIDRVQDAINAAKTTEE